MKKTSLVSFLFILLVVTQASAGGLFSGCMGSGFGTDSTNRLYYQVRVEADGGTIANINDVTTVIAWANANACTIGLAVGANFGYKIATGSSVSRLYDVSGNFDCVAPSGHYPVITTNSKNGRPILTFNGATPSYMVASANPTFLNNGFTAFFVVSGSATRQYAPCIMGYSLGSNENGRPYVWNGYGTGKTYYGANNCMSGSCNLVDSSVLQNSTTYYINAWQVDSNWKTTHYYLNYSNDVSATTNVLSHGTSDAFAIGAIRYNNFYTSELAWTGNINAVIIFTEQLSTAQISSFNDVLNTMWAVY